MMASSDGTNVHSKYFCPENSCEFNEKSGSGKFFKRKLLVDQHIGNKHSEKKFKCALCSKKYAFEWQLRNHRKGCGLIWSCTTCDKTYSERLSLLVHCRRHGHGIPDGADFRDKSHAKRLANKDKECQVIQPPTVIILPILVTGNPFQIVQTRPILPKSAESLSTSTQTETCDSYSCLCPKCNAGMKFPKARQSTQTQTHQEDRMKGRASTYAQCAPVRSARVRKRKRDGLVKESTETQTMESSLVTTQSIYKSNVEPDRAKISIGVDTTGNLPLHKSNVVPSQYHSMSHKSVEIASTEMSVQTEDFSAVPNEYSTIETQTMCSDQELLSIFNNLENQDENDLFLELDMNDIETQTNWNDMDMQVQTTDASTCIDEFLKDFNF